MTERVGIVVVAGGSGSRMGAAMPKQFLEISGRPILVRTIERMREALPEAEIVDHSLAMLLRALMHLGIKEVTLAGFDGYAARRTNYYNSEMEYDFIKRKVAYLNAYMMNFLAEKKDQLTVNFLTDTVYEEK